MVIEGELPEDGAEHYAFPFAVPDGIAELEFRHDDKSSANVLDWGLEDPNGTRGWGGSMQRPGRKRLWIAPGTRSVRVTLGPGGEQRVLDVSGELLVR